MAMQTAYSFATQQPATPSKNTSQAVLFVKGLAKQCSERHLHTLFNQFGPCSVQVGWSISQAGWKKIRQSTS